LTWAGLLREWQALAYNSVMQKQDEKIIERAKPGPKPKEHPLLTRSFRMSDVQWQAFEKQGGIKWLRVFLDSLGKIPIKKI
jgi:hypothetical protein